MLSSLYAVIANKLGIKQAKQFQQLLNLNEGLDGICWEVGDEAFVLGDGSNLIEKLLIALDNATQLEADKIECLLNIKKVISEENLTAESGVKYSVPPQLPEADRAEVPGKSHAHRRCFEYANAVLGWIDRTANGEKEFGTLSVEEIICGPDWKIDDSLLIYQDKNKGEHFRATVHMAGEFRVNLNDTDLITTVADSIREQAQKLIDAANSIESEWNSWGCEAVVSQLQQVFSEKTAEGGVS